MLEENLWPRSSSRDPLPAELLPVLEPLLLVQERAPCARWQRSGPFDSRSNSRTPCGRSGHPK